MINLICFPHYTAGGLLCDIMSDTYSPIDSNNGGIKSIQHSIGKIGDTDTVLTDFNLLEFMATLTKKNLPNESWVGTHCWPGELPVDQFNKVILITTATSRSKIYRWIRCHYHYFSTEWKSLELTGMEKIDKLRETAKNYLIPFNPVFADNVTNIEFADIVDNTSEFRSLVGDKNADKHIQRWQKINEFLYDPGLWNTELVKSFYEAEHETALNRHYLYY